MCDLKKQCTDCGCDLPADAPGGHCPHCLLSLVHSAISGIPESDESPETDTAADFSPEKPGQVIGRYMLLEVIGEGGCGTVYIAEQSEPVRRQVALKVIKAGMDTKEVLARFEAERQALAIMDHPNIAKIFDAGATDQGRPYFVMELVRGLRITEYCDQHNLTTTDRLELFIQVCRAAQHAHEKGIVHRDIKPSNILVTLHDGIPVPKVIDFGIAKATTGQQLTDKTIFTAFERFVGTPAYMSPEQAEMSGLGIDARSDVYSLGVLLYELLTGRTPFETKELVGAGLDAMRRIIREQEPLRPSTRLSGLKSDEQTAAARQRRTEPAKLIHLMRGDLDWIVLKCLEKDRQRRYESANGLALDIKRHLGQEIVTARAPSHYYRLQKFVRRNRTPVTIAGCVAVSLLVVLGVTARLMTSFKNPEAVSVAHSDSTTSNRSSESLTAAQDHPAPKILPAATPMQTVRDSGTSDARILDDLIEIDGTASHPAEKTIDNLLTTAHTPRIPVSARSMAARSPENRTEIAKDGPVKRVDPAEHPVSSVTFPEVHPVAAPATKSEEKFPIVRPNVSRPVGSNPGQDGNKNGTSVYPIVRPVADPIQPGQMPPRSQTLP